MRISSKISRGLNSVGWTLSLLLLSAMLAIGHAQSSDKIYVEESSEEVVFLGLVGFNYTDRHISEYSVDGASGGHINMSTPTSGGSGVTCCVRISKRYKDRLQVKVRWQVDGCKFVESNPRTGAMVETRRFYYKEVLVDVQPVVDGKANFIETHFYPDGKVDVHLTMHGSNPKLALAGNRPDKSHFPRCKNV